MCAMLYEYPTDKNPEITDNRRIEYLVNTSKEVKDFVEKKGVKRGDLCRFGDSNYRNDGILIYDGEKFLDLDRSHWDHGVIPNEFQVVKEFPINHWKDVLVYHSDVVRYNVNKDDFKASTLQCLKDQECYAFRHDNITFIVLLDDEYEFDTDMSADYIYNKCKSFIKYGFYNNVESRINDKNLRGILRGLDVKDDDNVLYMVI